MAIQAAQHEQAAAVAKDMHAGLQRQIDTEIERRHKEVLLIPLRLVKLASSTLCTSACSHICAALEHSAVHSYSDAHHYEAVGHALGCSNP
jgi:hypothetical protein